MGTTLSHHLLILCMAHMTLLLSLLCTAHVILTLIFCMRIENVNVHTNMLRMNLPPWLPVQFSPPSRTIFYRQALVPKPARNHDYLKLELSWPGSPARSSYPQGPSLVLQTGWIFFKIETLVQASKIEELRVRLGMPLLQLIEKAEVVVLLFFGKTLLIVM